MRLGTACHADCRRSAGVRACGQAWPTSSRPVAHRSAPVCEAVALEAGPRQGAAKAALPHSYNRLCGRRVGEDFRGVAEVETVQTPELEGEQVLVRVRYAGVNGGCETFRVRGEPGTPFEHNRQAGHYLLGAETAGEVAALGPKAGDALAVGDAVTVSASGGFGEYVLTNARRCFRVREASAAAVAVALSGVTAAAALWVLRCARCSMPSAVLQTHTSCVLYTQEVTGGPLQAGQVVLVTAAAGGTGHFGAQLAQLAGCRVVAVCGGPAKAARLRSLGLERVIDYKAEDVGDVLDKEYGGQIDIAYEGVGGPLRDAVFRNLKPKGRLLAVGYIGSYPHVPSTVRFKSAEGLPDEFELMWRGQTIEVGGRTVYGNVWSGAKGDAITECRAKLFELFYAGKLQAWVDEREFRGVEQVVPAVEHMLSGASIGKVVAAL